MVGTDAKNKNILDKKYICSKCLLILRDPVQLNTCGHRLCQSCIDPQHEAIIKCVQCQTEISQDEEHLDQFHPNPKCKYCGEQFNSVNNFNEHKVLQCRKVTVDCVLKDFGCNEQIIREKRDEHYLTEQHQATVLKIIHQIRLKLYDTPIGSGLPQTTTATTDDPVTAQLQALYDKINTLSGGIEVLSDDVQRLNNESLQTQIQLQVLAENFSQVKLSIEETQSFLEGMQYNQSTLNQELLSLKEEISDMQHVSYDGIYIWKITNFQEKMTNAKSNRQTSIYSPSFYSSSIGYKMKVRLYLNGDGNAHQTHMSIFFVLMRGLYDSILKFPFNYKVTFCMYDQTPTQRHIIDSFRPDIRSNSFHRPRSDMNIASGIPKFIPLSIIEQEDNPYVQNNTIFIKVMIDFGNMPKSLLPYVLSLNPGLPTHVQQAMIEEEAERRAQQRSNSSHE